MQEDSCGALLAIAMHAKLQRVWHTRSPTAFFSLVDEATRHLKPNKQNTYSRREENKDR